MKKISLLLTVLTLPVLVNAAPRARIAFRTPLSSEMLKARVLENVQKTAGKYLPKKENYYGNNFGQGAWTLEQQYEYTYTTEGRVSSMLYDNPNVSANYRGKNTYTYDANGQTSSTVGEISNDKGATWTLSSKEEKSYDAVLTSLPILSNSYFWSTGWTLRTTAEKIIARNSARTLTTISEQTTTDGVTLSGFSQENTVGADGKSITSTKSGEYNNDVEPAQWEEFVELRDIVWQKTDGQAIFRTLADMCSGNNRVKSAKVYSDGVLDGTLSVEYLNDFEATLTINFTDGTKLTYERKYTDAGFGSYSETTKLISPTASQISEYAKQPETSVQMTSLVKDFDEYGNLIYECQTEDLGAGVQQLATSYENSYNELGQLTQIIAYVHIPNPVPYLKRECSDFFFTDITNIDIDQKETLYTLDGREVTHPTAGIYIRRQGDRTSKIILR